MSLSSLVQRDFSVSSLGFSFIKKNPFLPFGMVIGFISLYSKTMLGTWQSFPVGHQASLQATPLYLRYWLELCMQMLLK